MSQSADLLLTAKGRDKLGMMLGPLLCKNAREQDLFKEIYQGFLSSLVEEKASKVALDEEVKTPNQAPWWLPAAIAVGLLALAFFGLDWYKNKYGEGQKLDRFQYEVLPGLDDFTLGDTLDLINHTAPEDTAGHTFHWYITDRSGNEVWSHQGFERKQLIFDNPIGWDHQLKFIVRRKSGSQVFSAKPQSFRVDCPDRPRFKSLIQVAGERKPGSPLQFSIATDADSITYLWTFNGADESREVSPIKAFEQAGEYRIMVEIADTSGQRGYCKDVSTFLLEIEEDSARPTLVSLPALGFTKDFENQYVQFSKWP